MKKLKALSVLAAAFLAGTSLFAFAACDDESKKSNESDVAPTVTELSEGIKTTFEQISKSQKGYRLEMKGLVEEQAADSEKSTASAELVAQYKVDQEGKYILDGVINAQYTSGEEKDVFYGAASVRDMDAYYTVNFSQDEAERSPYEKVNLSELLSESIDGIPDGSYATWQSMLTYLLQSPDISAKLYANFVATTTPQISRTENGYCLTIDLKKEVLAKFDAVINLLTAMEKDVTWKDIFENEKVKEIVEEYLKGISGEDIEKSIKTWASNAGVEWPTTQMPSGKGKTAYEYIVAFIETTISMAGGSSSVPVNQHGEIKKMIQDMQEARKEVDDSIRSALLTIDFSKDKLLTGIAFEGNLAIGGNIGGVLPDDDLENSMESFQPLPAQDDIKHSKSALLSEAVTDKTFAKVSLTLTLKEEEFTPLDVTKLK